MRLIVALLASIGVSGCASFDRKALEESGLWPSRTEGWCHPRVRYERFHKRYHAGIRCYVSM